MVTMQNLFHDGGYSFTGISGNMDAVKLLITTNLISNKPSGFSGSFFHVFPFIKNPGFFL